jgi:hypothetical protein
MPLGGSYSSSRADRGESLPATPIPVPGTVVNRRWADTDPARTGGGADMTGNGAIITGGSQGLGVSGR